MGDSRSERASVEAIPLDTAAIPLDHPPLWVGVGEWKQRPLRRGFVVAPRAEHSFHQSGASIDDIRRRA
jgi:hypothetical protein